MWGGVAAPYIRPRGSVRKPQDGLLSGRCPVPEQNGSFAWRGRPVASVSMAHTTARSAYSSLIDRLNRFPQGAPPSDLLYRILRILFTEREASLVASLPIRPFTAETAARAWKTTPDAARGILESLAARALLIDVVGDGETRWVLPPPMAGFFEFSMMRVRGDVDQKALAELFYQYLNVEEDFVRALFSTGPTQLGRDVRQRERPARR